MSIRSISLSVDYAYPISAADFKRALLVAILEHQKFAHLSDFHRWLAHRIESFGVEDLFYGPIQYGEYPGGQRGASQALLALHASWFSDPPPATHTLALKFMFDAHDLQCYLAHAVVLCDDPPQLQALSHREVLELCIYACIEYGRSGPIDLPNAEPYLIRQCTDTVERLFGFIVHPPTAW